MPGKCVPNTVPTEPALAAAVTQDKAAESSDGPEAAAGLCAPSTFKEKLLGSVAGALYRTGVLRVVQRISHTYEIHRNSRGHLRAWRRVSRPKSTILCYHRVGTAGVPLFSSLRPDIFEAQIRFLAEGYRVVSLGQLHQELQEPRAYGQSVAVTFDDGYRDLYTYAFPILVKYRIPAAIFVVVESIESGEAPWYDRTFLSFMEAPGDALHLMLDRPRCFQLSSPRARFHAGLEVVSFLRTLPDQTRRGWCADLERQVKVPEAKLQNRMLSWDQIREMHRAGVSFGSHTLSHPVVSQLGPEDLHRELSESKRIMEDRLGAPVTDFAYPFGKSADCGPHAASALARCGYRLAVTTTEGVNTPETNPYEFRRQQVGERSSPAVLALELVRCFLEDGSQTDRDLAAFRAVGATAGRVESPRA